MQVFQQLDQDNDGVIDFSELHLALNTGGNYSQHEVEEMIAKHDVTETGS